MALDGAPDEWLKGMASLVILLGLLLWLVVFMRTGAQRLLLLGTVGLAGTALAHVLVLLPRFPAVC